MLHVKYIQKEIIDRIKPFKPEKIFIFGSHAINRADDDSDIDIFIITEYNEKNIEAKILMAMRDLIRRYQVGFDVIVVSKDKLKSRRDLFYEYEVLKKGKLIYAK